MSIINDFKNEFRFSAHGRTSRRNFWIYQIGLFVLGLAVAMGCGTIIGLTNAVVGFWFIIAALLILPFGIANIFVTIRRLHDMGYSGYWYFALLAAGMFASALDKVVPVATVSAVSLSMRFHAGALCSFWAMMAIVMQNTAVCRVAEASLRTVRALRRPQRALQRPLRHA